MVINVLTKKNIDGN